MVLEIETGNGNFTLFTHIRNALHQFSCTKLVIFDEIGQLHSATWKCQMETWKSRPWRAPGCGRVRKKGQRAQRLTWSYAPPAVEWASFRHPPLFPDDCRWHERRSRGRKWHRAVARLVVRPRTVVHCQLAITDCFWDGPKLSQKFHSLTPTCFVKLLLALFWRRCCQQLRRRWLQPSSFSRWSWKLLERQKTNIMNNKSFCPLLSLWRIKMIRLEAFKLTHEFYWSAHLCTH